MCGKPLIDQNTDIITNMSQNHTTNISKPDYEDADNVLGRQSGSKVDSG